ncbi:MAG: extensin family protein [Sandaracinobacter sp.]
MRLRRATALFLMVAVAGCGGNPAPGPVPAPGNGPQPGAFVALNQDPAKCSAVLERMGVRATFLPAKAGPAGCGYPWAVQRTAVPQGHPRWLGETPATSCAVAAALTQWERDVLQPAARRHLGVPVTGIRHYGSYGCRPRNNRPGAELSEHARANAIDIAGFQLASGRTVTVKEGWAGKTEERAFLRDLRNGACRRFGTVLSPDYDLAHADHLHVDQIARTTPFCR